MPSSPPLQSRSKENAKILSKNFTTQENIRTSRLKENGKTYTKKTTSNQKLNQWIKNLQDELYQTENKQTKGAKLGATLLWLIVGGWGQNTNFGEKSSSSFSYYKKMT